MALEESFTYTVVPRRPIRNLVKGKCIIKETTLSLTKSEVKECLKYGKVYRKFYLESSEMERVTPSNLDRLHRSNHISEADYNNLSGKRNKTVPELSNDCPGTVKSQPEEQQEESVEIIDNSTEDKTVAVDVEVKKAEEEQLSTDSLISTFTEDIDDSEYREYENTTEYVDGVNETMNNGNHSSSNQSRTKKKRNKHRNNNSETSSVPKTAAEESN